MIFHLAAQMDVRVSTARPDYDAQVNVLGTVNMLEAAAEAGVRRFVFTSTGGAIYGEADELPATEGRQSGPRPPTARRSSPPRATATSIGVCTGCPLSASASGTSTDPARTPSAKPA